MRHGIALDLTQGSLLGGARVPSWVVNPANPPDIAIDWVNNRAWQKTGGLVTPTSLISTTRSSSKTNLFPSSVSGFLYSTFGANTASLTSSGLSIEEARTNVLLNSIAPATQTTASLGTGTYTLWVNGSGSATPSAGTATITGAAAATNGSPNVFTVTVAGTVTITVAGSLNAFQCELGSYGTSLIVTAGTTAARTSDLISLTTPPTFGSAFSLYSKATPQMPATYPNNQGLGGPSDGTSTNRAFVDRVSGSGNTAGTAISSTGPYNSGNISPSGSWVQNTSGKLAMALAALDGAVVFNAGTPAASATIVMPNSISAYQFGTTAFGGSFFNGLLEYSAMWASQRVPNAQLQTITT